MQKEPPNRATKQMVSADFQKANQFQTFDPTTSATRMLSTLQQMLVPAPHPLLLLSKVAGPRCPRSTADCGVGDDCFMATS